jgi:hypothetical protein
MSLTSIEKAKFTNKPNNGVGVLSAATAGALNADTNGVIIYTPFTYGGRVESLVISSNDTGAVNCLIYILNGATVKPLGIVNVPAASGNNASLPNIDALLGTGITLQGMPLDVTGKPYIPLMAGDVLKMSCLGNMTAAKVCVATALGADYSSDPTL